MLSERRSVESHWFLLVGRERNHGIQHTGAVQNTNHISSSGDNLETETNQRRGNIVSKLKLNYNYNNRLVITGGELI